MRRIQEKAHGVSECVTPEENQISSFSKYRLAEPYVTDLDHGQQGDAGVS